MMKLSIRRDDQTARLTLRGDLDALASDPLRETLAGLVEEGARVLELDMLRVRYLTSTGVSVLLGLRKRLAAVDGALRIVSASPGVRSTLDVLGFGSMLDVPLAEVA